jgi:hypothetical protein
MACRWIRIGYAPVMAARITYFGELGWELHIPTEFVAHVYETLRAAGAAFGITDAGYKAINSLRMEKRYLYWSADISPDETPLEAGLGFAVSLRKGDFLGKDALLAQKEGRSQTAARMLRVGNPALGLWRGGDDRQRQGDRHDHQRRFRPLPSAARWCLATCRASILGKTPWKSRLSAGAASPRGSKAASTIPGMSG